jgi:Ca-activated chloride channel homolog
VVTGSGLAWPWLLGVAVLAVVVVGVWAWRTKGGGGDARWVANTAFLEELPELRRAVRVYAVLRGVGVAALVLAVVAAGVVAARPVQREVTTERLGTRDIVLCLDVSGSMVPFDSAIVETFARLVEGFAGERVALSIFNSTSRTVFPLTDDYPLVLDELEATAEALDVDLFAFDPNNPLTWGGIEEFLEFAGASNGVAGESSLIGDGLASCALLFDEQATERSRSIILATDNDVLGKPIYSLPEAVRLVASRDVHLYGLYGGDELLRGSPQNQEFTEAIEQAGGMTWFAEDPGAVEAVIEDVTAQQAVVIDSGSDPRLVDRPQPWVTVLVLAVLAVLVVRWRLRE